TPTDGVSITILYPETRQQFALDERCALTEPLIVYAEGIELVAPPSDSVEGQGHWHGGPSLTSGYCASSVAFCDGASAPDPSYQRYDGSGMKAGLLTLFVELQDNLHNPLGYTDQVEIELTDPTGSCGAAAE
ncbi:MAG: hypothetical protein ABMB14_39515, partial [Myxococcota bacterium]